MFRATNKSASSHTTRRRGHAPSTLSLSSTEPLCLPAAGTLDVKASSLRDESFHDASATPPAFGYVHGKRCHATTDAFSFSSAMAARSDATSTAGAATAIG